MTSKNLFFRLMKENTKRRLWVIALLSLYFFFRFPVWTAMLISSYRPEQGTASAEYIARMKLNVLEEFLDWNSIHQGEMVFMMSLFAVICAVSGFSYLFSKRKVDFYHSVPVRREMLFATNYLNGILYAAVPYLTGVILSSVLVQVEVATPFPWGTVLTGFVLHMAFYILIYSTVVTAIMLTGNTVVAILGTLVFFLYGPVVILLKYGYYGTFFATFDSGSGFPASLMSKSSPFAWYVSAASADESAGMKAVWAIIIAAILTVISLNLYKLRPSEAAGKAMAFKKSQPVIKILLVVPSALLGGLLFSSITDSDGWSVFGLLCGLIITYCIIEIIYSFDFRRLFAHKMHLAVCAIISAAIFAFFRFDLSGYDSYIPSADNIASGGFYSYYLDSDTNENYRVTASISKYNYLIFKYGTEEELLRDMKITDTEDLLAIARQGIRDVKAQKEIPVYYSGGTSDGGDIYRNVMISYQLKNGKRVSRSYYMNVTAVEDAVFAIYDRPEYKEAVYPVLLEDASNIAGINYKEYDDFSHVKLSDEAMKEALLTVYQKELRELTAETRKRESPIAGLQFKTRQIQEMIETLKETQGEIYQFNHYYYYPIYPSFTETIALLKQSGIDVGHFLNGGNVEKIEVIGYSGERDRTVQKGSRSVKTESVYDYNMTEEVRRTITNPAQIEEILRVSYAEALSLPNTLRVQSGYRVTAYMKKSGQKEPDAEFNDESERADGMYEDDDITYNLYLFEDAVPDFLTK